MKMFLEENKPSINFFWKIMTAFEGKLKSVSQWHEGTTVASPIIQSCTGNIRWFSIIIVGKKLHFIILVLFFRWKRRFPS